MLFNDLKSNPASSRAPGSPAIALLARASRFAESRVASLRRAPLGRRFSAGLLERVFLGIGAVAIAIVAGAHFEAALYQRRLSSELEQLAPPPIGAPPAPHAVSAARAALRNGGLIGRIEVPRLGVSAMIAEGVDRKMLRVAVGHVPGTALPGEDGNVAVAGHRDTFFRALRNIAPADTVRVNTVDGSFLYQVDSTFVVSPDRVDLVAPTGEHALTMITCYPFNYVGSAPRRFVVRARQIGPVL